MGRFAFVAGPRFPLVVGPRDNLFRSKSICRFYSDKNDSNISVANRPIYLAAKTPQSLTKRTVYIYSPSKSSTQSGEMHCGTWRIDFDVQERWENPLMGWTSSRDPMQALYLSFDSKDDAIRFASRQGWNFEVIEPETASWKEKSYSDNFRYSKDKLRFIRTK